MEPPQYHHFGSSDDSMVHGEEMISPQRGMKRKLVYVLYGVLVLLTLTLLLVTELKFSQLNQEIADVKLNLESIQTSIGLSDRTPPSSDKRVQEEMDVYYERIVPVRGSCDEGWVFFQSSCYLLSTETATWSRAEEQCITHAAHLLVVNNVEELDYMSRIARITWIYWIGLVEREHEGLWTWVDGTDYKSTPTFWDVGQPDDWDYRQEGEDCGQLHDTEIRKRKLWNDADCNLEYRYICEAVKPGH